jgi:hypothetical protein
METIGSKCTECKCECKPLVYCPHINTFFPKEKGDSSPNFMCCVKVNKIDRKALKSYLENM